MNIERLKEIFTVEDNITRTAKQYCQENNILYSDSVRRRVSGLLKNVKIDDDLENSSVTLSNDYINPVSQLSALKPDGSIMPIKEYCEFYKIPFEDVRTYKLITHSSKGAYYNLVGNPIKGEGLKISTKHY